MNFIVVLSLLTLEVCYIIAAPRSGKKLSHYSINWKMLFCIKFNKSWN